MQYHRSLMLSPFLSRLVLRVFGLALLGWSALRLWFALELWRETGQWADVARVAAVVLAAWSTADGITSILLLAAKNWARYLAFVTLAAHFALTAFFVKIGASSLFTWALACFAALAALLVLASNADKE